MGHTALRMQLKAMRFESAPLRSVAELLGPGFVSRRRRQLGSSDAAGMQAAPGGEIARFLVASLYSQHGVGAVAAGDGDLEVQADDTDAEWLAARWGQMTTLALNDVGLGEGLADDTLRLAYQVRVLELRGNGITAIGVGCNNSFHKCERLEHLDLSRNRLEGLPALHLSLGNVSTLILSHNRLSSTSGLERLFSVVELDLSHNAIRDPSEVRRLASLPNLEGLWLRCNPLADDPHISRGEKEYRRIVFGAFTEYVSPWHVHHPSRPPPRLTRHFLLFFVLLLAGRPRRHCGLPFVGRRPRNGQGAR